MTQNNSSSENSGSGSTSPKPSGESFLVPDPRSSASEPSSPESSQGEMSLKPKALGESHSVADLSDKNGQHVEQNLWTRIREAIGTVYGDIGTSVL